MAGALLPSAPVLARPCLTPKPAPACPSCFVTEIGYSYQVTPPLKARFIQMVGDSVTYDYESEVAGRHYLTSELGYVYNFDARYGIGFTHFTGWDVDNSVHGGLKLRVRRWLTPGTFLDLSGGAILWDFEDGSDRGFVGGASVTFSEWESVNLMIASVRTRDYDTAYDFGDGGPIQRSISPPRSKLGMYLGYKVSSKPGLLLNGGAVAAVGIGCLFVLAALSGSN